jgi:hypothetical protein
MSANSVEKVTHDHHCNESLFAFQCAREPFRHQGRLTDLMHIGRLLDDTGLRVSPCQGGQGDDVFERTFVER